MKTTIFGQSVIVINALLFLTLLFPCSLYAESNHQLRLFGLIRVGGIDLYDADTDAIETTLSVESDEITNIFGRSVSVEYVYKRFGLGLRAMRYKLSGGTTLVNQTLTLDYIFGVLSLTVFDDLFSNSDNDSQIGIGVGVGQNFYQLVSQSRASTTADWSTSEDFKSTSGAGFTEIYFSSLNTYGWGYRAGVFRIDGRHAALRNSNNVSGSIEFGTYFTLMKQFY